VTNALAFLSSPLAALTLFLTFTCAYTQTDKGACTQQTKNSHAHRVLDISLSPTGRLSLKQNATSKARSATTNAYPVSNFSSKNRMIIDLNQGRLVTALCSDT
jgi:hypothetical protein